MAVKVAKIKAMCSMMNPEREQPLISEAVIIGLKYEL